VNRKKPSIQQVCELVRRYLQRGKSVHIDGLGVFEPDGNGSYAFIPDAAQKVFIAYAEEDLEAAERLYIGLESEGFRPWLDRRKLRPGRNWPGAIERAIEISDYVIACFSANSVRKRGHFQSELRFALQCAAKMPVDDIYLIPVRLDDCTVPESIRRQLQYVDMFPNWEEGQRRVLDALRRKQET
jgi:hypothetical protein